MSIEGRGPRAPLGGRQATWPFVAAFVGAATIVLVIVLVNVFAGNGTTGSRQQGDGLTADGAVACPEFFEHADTAWVPAKPAGVASKRKMVPTLHPTHVTVCRYGVATTRDTSVRLAGQRELTGRLDRVVDTLRALPAASRHPRSRGTCAAPPAARDYLIGMRYAEAIVWVSAPGVTCGSGNGVFASDHDLSSVAEASFAARTWVAPAG